MPLSGQQRLALRRQLNPAADQRLYGRLNQALARFIRPGATVLDAGAGPGTWILNRYRRQVGLAVGADVAFPPGHQAATGERFLTEWPVRADLTRLPFADASFDLILCYDVLEHLVDPGAVFREFARLLAPGGGLVFKTPCLTSPTILASHLLPFSWHRAMKRRLTGKDDVDAFPTYYRCNTLAGLDRALRNAQLHQEFLATADQTYEYFYFSGLTYRMGLGFSRLTGLPGLRWLGNVIIGAYSRPAAYQSRSDS